MGDVNPRMGSLPPDVVLRLLVFQLRAFVNAGFRAMIPFLMAAIAISWFGMQRRKWQQGSDHD